MTRDAPTVADIEAADTWLCERQDEVLRASNLAFDIARLHEDDGADAGSVVRHGDLLAGAFVDTFDGMSALTSGFRAASRVQVAREIGGAA